jgi:retron-type reverse transcriptase
LAKTSSHLIRLYFKYQFKNLVALLLFVGAPFVFIKQYEIPHMHFYFLGVLFAIKLLAYDDATYAKNLKKALPKVLGSNSNSLIFKSTQSVVLARNINLIATGIFIILVEIIG